MPDPGFLAMRADLVERGLLEEDFSLTVAGCAFCDEQIEQLLGAAPPGAPRRPPIQWNFKRRRAA